LSTVVAFQVPLEVVLDFVVLTLSAKFINMRIYSLCAQRASRTLLSAKINLFQQQSSQCISEYPAMYSYISSGIRFVGYAVRPVSLKQAKCFSPFRVLLFKASNNVHLNYSGPASTSKEPTLTLLIAATVPTPAIQ
jgi:hypothetical protein